MVDVPNQIYDGATQIFGPEYLPAATAAQYRRQSAKGIVGGAGMEGLQAVHKALAVLDRVNPPEEVSHSFFQQYEVFFRALPICIVTLLLQTQ